MENNLTRARSISVARSPSVASTNMDQKSPTSPRFPGLGQRGNGWAISAAKLRQTGFTGSAGSGGHTRVVSDTSVPSKPSTFGGRQFNNDRFRSTSAMGSKEMDYESQTDDRGFTSRTGRYLEPLQEDELAQSQADEAETPPNDQSSSSRLSIQSPTHLTKARSSLQLRDLREQMADLRGKVHSLKQRTKEDNMRRRSMQMLKSPNPFTDAEHYTSAETSSKRASSSAAGHLDVPHIQIGGKASTDGKSTVIDDVSQVSQGTSPILANKTTPMTDNASETFPSKEEVKEPSEEDDDDEPIEVNEIVKPQDEEADKEVVPMERAKNLEAQGYDDLPPPPKTAYKFDPSSPHSLQADFVTADDDASVYSANGRPEEDASDSTGPKHSSTSDEALSSPQTSVSSAEEDQGQLPPPQIMSHEDRPDAFDYETFVLNSTMGSFSRQGMRSSSSASSTSTIGPGEHYGFIQPHFLDAHSQLSLADSPPRESSSRRGHHERRGSDESVSSVNTFATATSGDDYTNGVIGVNGINGVNGLHSNRVASRSASRSQSRSQSRAASRAAQSQASYYTTIYNRPQSSTSTHPRYTSAIYNPNFNSAMTKRSSLPQTDTLGTNKLNRSSFSPTNEATSIQARSQILSALLADPVGGNARATPEILAAIRPEDEALIRAVIGGLQRACGNLVRGDEKGVRQRLEAARKALEGVGLEGMGRNSY